MNSNVYPIKNTNSRYLFLNTAIIPLCNGKISIIFLWGKKWTAWIGANKSISADYEYKLFFMFTFPCGIVPLLAL